ncbi:MAG: sugar phosphate isomerase/epimerase family protein [Acidobacteriota bacterium]
MAQSITFTDHGSRAGGGRFPKCAGQGPYVAWALPASATKNQPQLEHTMLTRREFGTLTLSSLVLPPRLAGAQRDSMVGGVRLGAQTYSFRDLPRGPAGDAVDAIITAFGEVGLDDCELWAPQVEPRATSREALRTWRLQTPLDHFRAVKKKFDAAGITIYAYNYSFNASFTDDEIDRGFEMAKALGAGIITASTTLDVAQRVVPFAAEHRMVVAMHNHSNVTDPNEFATPESFAAATRMSAWFKINLDIGHFTAANFDAVAFLGERHLDITNLHIKDRKKDQGANVPWGQGDTPIRAVLQLLKKERWPIRAHVEYEYQGAGSSVDEVKKCVAYATRALT